VLDYELQKLRRKHQPALRRKLGIIFQDFQLLTDRTVEQNLRFVLKATGWKNEVEIRQRIEEVLNEVQMQTKGYKFPHELSGGEQQRFAVARALINHPAVVLADEPSGNLDTRHAEELHELFFRLRDQYQQTFVIVTHNNTLAQKSDRQIRLRDGGIVNSED
jgi:cell division transport system ATP-binding protein